MLLRNNEKFVVLPRGNENIINVPLIDTETSKLTQMIRDAVRSLFDRFAVAKPESPNKYFIGTDEAKALMSAVSTKASERP